MKTMKIESGFELNSLGTISTMKFSFPHSLVFRRIIW